MPFTAEAVQGERSDETEVTDGLLRRNRTRGPTGAMTDQMIQLTSARRHLPAAERVELAMASWDSLSDAERDVEFVLTPKQAMELDRPWAAHVDDPESTGTARQNRASGVTEGTGRPLLRRQRHAHLPYRPCESSPRRMEYSNWSCTTPFLTALRRMRPSSR